MGKFCKQLFDDLVKVEKGGRRTHFFGSIVSVYQPSGRTTMFLVVDGQQRLTTVSLLLLAIRNLLKAGKVDSEDPNLAQRIYEEYLVDRFHPEATRIKLKPGQNDREAFSKLFGEESKRVVDSQITKNYDYFVQRILANEITVDEIVEAIEKLLSFGEWHEPDSGRQRRLLPRQCLGEMQCYETGTVWISGA